MPLYRPLPNALRSPRVYWAGVQSGCSLMARSTSASYSRPPIGLMIVWCEKEPGGMTSMKYSPNTACPLRNVVIDETRSFSRVILPSPRLTVLPRK
jgi:hypothetical protein